MSLAALLSLCVVFFVSPSLSVHPLTAAAQSAQNQNLPEQSSQNPAGEAGQSGNSAPTPKQAPSGSQTQSSPPATVKAGQKRVRHKKSETASAPTDCPPTKSTTTPAAADGSAAASPSPSSPTPNAEPSNAAKANPPGSTQVPQNPAQPNSAPPKDGTGNSAPSSKPSPENCPPAKTVIKEGGTSEPAIQLLGSKGTDVASRQRTTTDQLLESTEDDLKKVAGRQLSSSQQEMVNQIREFVQQSRAAEAAGDTERARNLARKAHLLSDELVKP